MRNSWRCLCGLILTTAIAVTTWQSRAADETITPANAYDPSQGFVVHEWGVAWFAKDATPVSEELPAFVHHPEVDTSACKRKPVIYLYGGGAVTQASVTVQFNGCTPTSWYPHIDLVEVRREIRKETDMGDIGSPALHWSRCELKPTGQIPAAAGTPDWWIACRDSDADTITVNGETEKFLYYETTRAFAPAITYTDVTLINSGGEALQDVFVLAPGEHFYLALPQLDANGNISCGKNQGDAEAVKRALREALVRSGLFDKEIVGFMAAWDKELFEGDRRIALYRLPDAAWNAVSELHVEPQPAAVKRSMWVAVEF